MAELRQLHRAGDARGICALMTDTARTRATGSPRIGACGDKLAELLVKRRQSTSRMRTGSRELKSLRVTGSNATAIVALNELVPGVIRMVERDGAWKLDSLAVRPLQARSKSKRVVEGTSESFSDFREWAGRQGLCPPVEAVRNGSCSLEVSASAAPLILLTALGDFEVARCAAVYRLYIDTINIIGHDVEFFGSPRCSRMEICRDRRSGLRNPWWGNKVPGADGVVALRLNVCLETSDGRVAGMQFLELRRDGRAWRLRPADYPVGESSLQIGGRWRVEPRGVASEVPQPEA